MDISYKWLKRFIDFNLSPSELASVLTSLGLECDHVEEVESIRGGLRGIVIGKVLTCVEHPNSDHLHITEVDLGGEAPVQIVCGAPNVAAGQTVVVATVGTTLYDGDKEFQIKKSKIRGVESNGMICAEDEIGIGKSHDGIIVIGEDVKPGTTAAEYYNVESDYRLEVELTPNRVDAASHYGTARDLKARLWCEATQEHKGNSMLPEVELPSVETFLPDTDKGHATIDVEDKEGCPRYCGVTVRNVKVEESPEWLKNLIIAAGQRPINNIVDITNYVLLGIGQPLHCFDLDKVKGEKIVVRTCPAGTKFTTLDGVEHTLHESDLMICDAEKPMCIAGVFGGLDSGVTEETKNVFIESAWFNPTRIRRTARRHGLSTDASFRYERGTDPLIPPYAAKLAALLIKELAGGEICGDVLDEYPKHVTPAEFDFSLEYCRKLIGKEIPRELIITILRALEIGVEERSDDLLHLVIPPYRVDVTRPCDVVEEILRVYGYNNVEIAPDMHATLSTRTAVDERHDKEQVISDMLTAQGFMEIMNNSLTAVSYYEENEKFTLEERVKVMNPLSGDLGVMRGTLLYGGLESISHNINRKAPDLKMYEFGNVYRFDPSAEKTAERPLKPYTERRMLGIWTTGNATAQTWQGKPAEADFYMLKGVVENIIRRLGVEIRSLTFMQDSDSLYSAKLMIKAKSGVEIGEMGIIRRKVLKGFDIEQPVCYAEIDWDALFKMSARSKVEFKPLPKTMPVRRDMALLIDKGVQFDEIERIIRKNAGKLLRQVFLFDVYEGKNLPEGKKSYAVAITLQDDEKTLQDKLIESVMKKVVDALKREVNAELR